MMKKTILLLSIIVFCLSCNSHEKKATDIETISSQSTSADSILFSMKGKAFTATLTTASPFIEVKTHITLRAKDAKGPFKWQRTGSLLSILSALYGGDVEFINKPYAGHHYSLKVKWRQTSFDEIKDNIAGKMKDTFGYSVKRETRKEPKFTISVKNHSMLKEHKYIFYDTVGTTSKTLFINDDWKIYGSLKKLVSVLDKKTGEEVGLKKDYGATSYYFKLTANHGIDGLINQLEKDYGLSFQKEIVPVEHYTIKF